MRTRKTFKGWFSNYFFNFLKFIIRHKFKEIIWFWIFSTIFFLGMGYIFQLVDKHYITLIALVPVPLILGFATITDFFSMKSRFNKNREKILRLEKIKNSVDSFVSEIQDRNSVVITVNELCRNHNMEPYLEYVMDYAGIRDTICEISLDTPEMEVFDYISMLESKIKQRIYYLNIGIRGTLTNNKLEFIKERDRDTWERLVRVGDAIEIMDTYDKMLTDKNYKDINFFRNKNEKEINGD